MSTIKKEKYLIQCLFCEKYLGYTDREKKMLKVCNEICRNSLNEKLSQDLNERAKSKMIWKKITDQEEELIVFTEKQYRDLVNNAHDLEQGRNVRGSVRNISQLLLEAKR